LNRESRDFYFKFMVFPVGNRETVLAGSLVPMYSTILTRRQQVCMANLSVTGFCLFLEFPQLILVPKPQKHRHCSIIVIISPKNLSNNLDALPYDLLISFTEPFDCELNALFVLLFSMFNCPVKNSKFCSIDSLDYKVLKQVKLFHN